MTLLNNRKAFSERIQRIEASRGANSVVTMPLQERDALQDLEHYPPRRPRRSVEVNTKLRGPVYLFAGFCAGLWVMTALSGASDLMALLLNP